MSLTDLPILDMLKSKLKWHQMRQGVLAQNIANADTPSYKARDLEKFGFEKALRLSAQSQISPKLTNVQHIAFSPMDSTDSFGLHKSASWEVNPSGNSVSLEDQMMKVTQNQMDYQAASSLYTRALGLLRIALDGGR